jgi:hypothetical protein
VLVELPAKIRQALVFKRLENNNRIYCRSQLVPRLEQLAAQ